MRVRNRDVAKPPFPELKTSGKLAIEPCPPLYQVQQCVLEYCVTNDTSPFDNSTSEGSENGKILSIAEKAAIERSQTVDGMSIQPEFHGKVLFTENELLQKIAADQQLITKSVTATDPTTITVTHIPSSTSTFGVTATSIHTLSTTTSDSIVASAVTSTSAIIGALSSSTSETNKSFINVGPTEILERQSGPLVSLPVVKDNQFELNTAEIDDLNMKLPSPGNFILFAGLPQPSNSSVQVQSSSLPQTNSTQPQVQSTSSQTSFSVSTDNMPIPDTFPIGTAKVIDPQATKITDAQITSINSTYQQKSRTTKLPATTIDLGQFFEDFDTTNAPTAPLPTSLTSGTSAASTTSATSSSASSTATTVLTTSSSIANGTNATTTGRTSSTAIIPSPSTTVVPQSASVANKTLVAAPPVATITATPVPTLTPAVFGGERPAEAFIPANGNTVLFGSPPGDKPQPRLHQNFLNRELPPPLEPEQQQQLEPVKSVQQPLQSQQSLELNKLAQQQSLDPSRPVAPQQSVETSKPVIQQPIATGSQQAVEPVKPSAGQPFDTVKLPSSAILPQVATRGQPAVSDQQPILPISVPHAPCEWSLALFKACFLFSLNVVILVVGGSQNGNKRCCKLSHRNKCPDGKPAQMVLRWFRFVSLPLYFSSLLETKRDNLYFKLVKNYKCCFEIFCKIIAFLHHVFSQIKPNVALIIMAIADTKLNRKIIRSNSKKSVTIYVTRTTTVKRCQFLIIYDFTMVFDCWASPPKLKLKRKRNRKNIFDAKRGNRKISLKILLILYLLVSSSF